MIPALLLALAALPPTLARANPVQFHYESSDWAYWIENSGHGFATYANPAHRATLDFTLAAPLAANLGTSFTPVDVTAQVLSWSYEGGQPFTRASGDASSAYFSLWMWTGATGEILQNKFYISNAPITVPGIPSGVASTLYVDSGYVAPGLNGSGYLQERVDYPAYLRCQGVNLYGQPYCYAGSEGGSTSLQRGTWTMTELPGGIGSLPEPGSLSLVALGLLAAARRRA